MCTMENRLHEPCQYALNDVEVSTKWIAFFTTAEPFLPFPVALLTGSFSTIFVTPGPVHSETDKEDLQLMFEV